MRNFKKNTLALTLLIVGFIIAIAGVTYAVIAVYGDIVGNENNTLVMGDIYMRYNENNQLTLENALPSEGPDETKYFEFTVSGKNTYTEKDIYYEIVLSHGDNHQTKTERIRDDLLKFRLVEFKDNQETIVVDNQSYNDLTSQRIWVNTISKDSKDEIDVTYRLYMWIDYNTVIGGGDADYDYDMDTWNNQVYGSIKVNVKGDFKERIMVVTNAKEFKTYILDEKSNTIVTDSDGTIYLSGTNTTVDYNYLWYSGKLWRITSINPDGTLKMITDSAITTINWGSKSTVSSSDLTSAYSTSYMREWLNQEFLPTLNNYEDIIVEDAGWYSITNHASTPTKPTGDYTLTDPVGLLNAYEYYMSYKNTSYSNGYLNIGYDWWLITPYTSSDVNIVNLRNIGFFAYYNLYCYIVIFVIFNFIKNSVFKGNFSKVDYIGV